MGYPKVIEDLLERLMKLPGVGRRSAERIVFWLLDHPADDASLLSEGILELKLKLRFCRLCNNFTEQDICPICTDQTRDSALLCVVENPKAESIIVKPCPFDRQTSIKFQATGKTNVRILDLQGREVKKLLPQQGADGWQNAVWDGTNSNGNSVPSGSYLVVTGSGNEAKSRIVIKK